MHFKFYLTSLLLSFSLIVTGQVIINEYSAANFSGTQDNFGDFEDWVELYNVGNASIDLSGYHLSDNINNPDKWVFPNGLSINGGDHMLIYCSDLDQVIGNSIHAGFKLTQTKQEYIVLSDPNQNLVDAIQIIEPNQTNHSTGRMTDGDSNWGIFDNPTPGSANTNAFTKYAETPVFSENAGFFDGAITVTITPIAGADIHYTLDGSEPVSYTHLTLPTILLV